MAGKWTALQDALTRGASGLYNYGGVIPGLPSTKDVYGSIANTLRDGSETGGALGAVPTFDPRLYWDDPGPAGAVAPDPRLQALRAASETGGALQAGPAGAVAPPAAAGTVIQDTGRSDPNLAVVAGLLEALETGQQIPPLNQLPPEIAAALLEALKSRANTAIDAGQFPMGQ
jgi:hypothetical protein